MNSRLVVLNIQEIDRRSLTSIQTGEEFSQSAVLTDFFPFENLFVHHERLRPGNRASAPHRHTLQEEMVFVLEGNPTVQIGDQVIQLKPGDFVGFSPSHKELHFIENRTQEECSFLVMCSNQKIDQVIY